MCLHHLAQLCREPLGLVGLALLPQFGDLSLDHFQLRFHDLLQASARIAGDVVDFFLDAFGRLALICGHGVQPPLAQFAETVDDRFAGAGLRVPFAGDALGLFAQFRNFLLQPLCLVVFSLLMQLLRLTHHRVGTFAQLVHLLLVAGGCRHEQQTSRHNRQDRSPVPTHRSSSPAKGLS